VVTGGKGQEQEQEQESRQGTGAGTGRGTGTGTSMGGSEAKGMKCDGNEQDQVGRARNEAETNWSQTGNKPDLAEKRTNSDKTPTLFHAPLLNTLRLNGCQVTSFEASTLLNSTLIIHRSLEDMVVCCCPTRVKYL
jgi:hypothetical protein